MMEPTLTRPRLVPTAPHPARVLARVLPPPQRTSSWPVERSLALPASSLPFSRRPAQAFVMELERGEGVISQPTDQTASTSSWILIAQLHVCIRPLWAGKMAHYHGSLNRQPVWDADVAYRVTYRRLAHDFFCFEGPLFFAPRVPNLDSHC